MSADRDLSHGLEDMAGMIHWWVGAWHDLGWENPPTPECKPIPPLGERSADAINAGHKAITEIDELIGRLHALRGQLVGELRQDADIRGQRIDQMVAKRQEQRQGAEANPAGEPEPEAGP